MLRGLRVVLLTALFRCCQSFDLGSLMGYGACLAHAVVLVYTCAQAHEQARSQPVAALGTHRQERHPVFSDACHRDLVRSSRTDHRATTPATFAGKEVMRRSENPWPYSGVTSWLVGMPPLPDSHAPTSSHWSNSVAICAVMKDENTTDIIEWLTYHQCAAPAYQPSIAHALRASVWYPSRSVGCRAGGLGWITSS